MRIALLWLVVGLASCSKPKPKPEGGDDPPRPAREPARPLTDDAAQPKWASDPPAVLRDKINGVNAHAVVLKSSGAFSEYRDVLGVVERTPGVIASEPFIFAELDVAKAGGDPLRIAVKAVDPARVDRVLAVGKHMQTGVLASLVTGTPPAIILGDVLARTLGVAVGDEVTLTAPNDPLLADDAGIIRAKPTRFRVTGTFHMDFDEYDERLGFVPLFALQAMLDRGDQVMGVELRVKHVDDADEIAKAIEASLGGPPYQVIDWYELNKELYTTLYGDRRP